MSQFLKIFCIFRISKSIGYFFLGILVHSVAQNSNNSDNSTTVSLLVNTTYPSLRPTTLSTVPSASPSNDTLVEPSIPRPPLRTATVDQLIDDGAANPENCRSNSSICTWSSAIALSKLMAFYASDFTIKLPHSGTVIIRSNASSVDTDLLFGAEFYGFHLVIQGNNATIQYGEADDNANITSTYNRSLLRVIAYKETNPKIMVSMSDFRVQGFGSDGSIGGAIYLEGVSDSTVQNVIFSRNRALHGGGLTLRRANNVKISGCTFISNMVVGNGAGLNMESSVNITVTLTEFYANLATSGLLWESSLRHSEQPYDAAALATANTDTSIESTTVTGAGMPFRADELISPATATGSSRGGAIYLFGSNIQLTDCRFIHNSAGEGGGLYLAGNSSDIRIVSSRVTSNLAESGGGMMIAETVSHLVVESCVFESNTASRFGGGIALFRGLLNSSISRTDFTENSAGLEGGAIYLANSTRD